MKKWGLTTRQQIAFNLLWLFALFAGACFYLWLTLRPPEIPICFPDSPDLRPYLSDLQEKSENDFLKSPPISIANVQNLSEFYSFDTPDDAVKSLTISEDSKFIVAAYVSGYESPKIFDLESGEITLISEIKSVNSIAISLDNKIIAFYDYDANIILWDMVSKTQIASWDVGNTSDTNTLLFTSNRDLIYLSGISVYLCDLSSKKNKKLFDKFGSGRLADILLDVSGTNIIFSTTGDNDSNGRAEVGIWNFDAPENLQIFDLNKPNAQIDDISVSLDGRRIASLSRDDTVNFIETQSGNLLPIISINNGSSNDYDIALNVDGGLMLVGNRPGFGYKTKGAKGYLSIWDVDKRTLITTLEAHTQELTTLTFNAAGNLLVTGSVDGTVKVWGVPPQ